MKAMGQIENADAGQQNKLGTVKPWTHKAVKSCTLSYKCTNTPVTYTKSMSVMPMRGCPSILESDWDFGITIVETN